MKLSNNNIEFPVQCALSILMMLVCEITTEMCFLDILVHLAIFPVFDFICHILANLNR